MKYVLGLTVTLALTTTAALADDHKFTCLMHPEIIRDEPGQCPVCGMELVPVPTRPDEEAVDENS